MRIEELDIVTLSDQKDYIVAKKVVMNGMNYYCFVDTDDEESFKFLYENNNNLLNIEDTTVFEKVLHLMSEAIRTNELLIALKYRLQAVGYVLAD